MSTTDAPVENGGTLTHAEIWDDSTLINAWDTALNEYKTYHSIKKSGSNDTTADITNKSSGPEVEMHDASITSAPGEEGVNIGIGVAPEQQEEGELKSVDDAQEGPQQTGGSEVSTSSRDANQSRQYEKEGKPIQPTMSTPIGHPPLPNHLIGGDNEALRNLMISWYFAGYYTGLYEGQQQNQKS